VIVAVEDRQGSVMGTRLAVVILTFLLGACHPSPRSEVEMEELQKWFSLPERVREPGYPYVRCGGLWESFLTYIDTEVFVDVVGEEKLEQYRFLAVLMISEANNNLSNRGSGELLDYLDKVLQETARFRDLYVGRMRRNYAATGEAFSYDNLILSDLTVCTQIAKQAMKQDDLRL